MKRLIVSVLALICILSLIGCSNDKTKVWDWAQGLNQEDITSATPLCLDASDKEFEPLSEAETIELVTLLNKLTKDSFTENKDLVGITPVVGIQIKLASETYYINYAPSPHGKYGALEMRYNEKMWWIDDAALLEFFQSVTANIPTE
jgi:hypothetical protein